MSWRGFGDMDKVKIDTQIVFPSLFLTVTSEDLRVRAALLRAYNSFLGECATASKSRIRFAALVPIRDVGESIKEIKRAATIGAAAVIAARDGFGTSCSAIKACSVLFKQRLI